MCYYTILIAILQTRIYIFKGKLHNTSMEKKRVLYFIPEFPRISETFIEREISKLVEWSNLDITVLSMAKASGSTSDEVLKRTLYKRIGIVDFIKGLAYLIAEPRKVIKLFREIGRPYFILKSLGYTSIIASNKPDHIHVHFLSWPSTMAMIASDLLGIPFSISAHARDVFLEGEFIAKKVGSAKFISICNSFSYKKALEFAESDVDKSKVKLIYHGIDPKMFEAPSKMEKFRVPAIFLGGTRLVEKKGLKYMIEASKILKERGIAHRVDLVGPGDLYQELGNMIDKLELHDTVFIHGDGKGTPFKEVLEYYKVADVFVLPSIETGAGDVDGVPTVVIEAAMAKLPIITTDAGGITDLIEDGVTGLVIEQRNSKAIADGIEKLLVDKNLADILSENAHAKAVKMFNIRENIGQLESLLK